MTALEPYPKYVDSGIEWLGQIPTSWDAGNIRRFAQMKTGHTPSRSREEYWRNCDIPWFTLADVWQLRQGQTFLGETNGLISKAGLDNSAAELLPEGTVVLSRTASVGFSGIMPRPMATSQDFWNWVCGPRLRPKFLWYQLLAMKPHFGFLVQGSTHKTIYQADAAALSVAVPELQEQDSLVRFLDRETAQIDAFIADQEELIGLLAERRAATISHAVAKGLDPTAPMKDSGFVWLGDVPDHWRVRRLSGLFALIGSGTTPSRDGGDYYGGDVPWVTTGELRESRIVKTRETVNANALRDLSALKVYPRESVLIAMYGATVGRLGILGIDAATNQACCAFAFPIDARSRYVYYALQAAKDHLLLLANGGGQPNINQEKLRQLRLPVPPVSEQDDILSYLDHETAQLDAATADAREAIALSRERRTALISAVVTGKIDVRGLA